MSDFPELPHIDDSYARDSFNYASESSFDFEAFVDGYIECILWCDAIPVHADPDHEDYEDSWESGGLQHLSVSDKTRADIIERAMLREFVAGNFDDLLRYCEVRAYDPSEGPVESYAGHDFYLTRAGHGAGFWDRGLGELGDRLTNASKSYGSPDDHMMFDNGDGTASL